MTRIDNILVVVDPSAHTHRAFEKALDIAKRCEARMELFACETKYSREVRYAGHLAAGGRGEFIANLRALLEPLGAVAKEQGVDVCVETDSGDPLYRRLLDRIQRTSADLVVKDTHHHSLAQRTLLTHTDWELIRGCPVPLLLTKDSRWRDPPAIAAAVDPGHVNDKPDVLDCRILDMAQLLANHLRGSVHVLHAYIPLLAAEAAGGSPSTMTLLNEQQLDQFRAARQEEVAALARSRGVAETNVRVELGVPSEVLPGAVLDAGIDIVVMGAISRRKLQRLFIGSTAERVLEHIPCDVLIVKPRDFAAALAF